MINRKSSILIKKIQKNNKQLKEIVYDCEHYLQKIKFSCLKKFFIENIKFF